MSTEHSPDAFSDFFRTAPVPIRLVDADGVIVSANHAELDLLGYRVEDYVGQHVGHFHVDADVAADFVARLSRAEPLRDYEARLRCADGGTKHVLITTDVRPDGIRVGHARCFTRDVTEAKVAERRLAVQYRVAQVLTGTTDTGEGLRRALSAICEELGWDVGEVWRRDEDADVLRLAASVERPGVDAAGLALLGRATSFARGIGLPGEVWVTGQPIWLDEIAQAPVFPRIGAAQAAGLRSACGIPIAVRGDGAGVLVCLSRQLQRGDEATVRTLRLVAGQIEQFLERKRAQEERDVLFQGEREARLEAELANRAKDDFLAGVSHELRTPLNAILGWSRLLRAGTLDVETVERGLAAIERNAEIQEQLIADLLDVARIATGKIQLNLEPTDLEVVIDAAIDTVRHAAAVKGLALEVRLERPLPLTLADPDRLQQVLWNLLSNAIRFTPPGGQVAVSAAARDHQVVIRVCDSGIGIGADFLPHVFDRFRQGETGTTRRQGGLGLGLSIVRHLAELHGGSVRADSAGEGRGATFTVELPLIAVATPPPAARESASLEPPTPSLQHVRILVVDDDSDAREMLGMVLRLHGAEVDEVSSAEAAVLAFHRHGPDVVISDIGLPDLDGYELIRQLRALDTPAAPAAIAVALTGWARSEDRAAALEAGFQAHVVKPVDPAELVSLLARLVASRRPAPIAGTRVAAA